jgi:hypothetical protein
MVGENKNEEIDAFDTRILYNLSEYITDMAIADLEDNYDNFFESIIEKANFQNFEDLIDALAQEIEKKLDEDITYFGFDYEDVKEILINERAFYDYDFDEETAEEFIERNRDTIAYMYENDFIFFLKEDLENDVLEKLDDQKETIIDKINGLLSSKFDDCFFGTIFIYINEKDLKVTISNRNDLEFEDRKLAGKVIGHGMSGIEVNFDFRGANITYYGCLSKYGFEFWEDLYF